MTADDRAAEIPNDVTAFLSWLVSMDDPESREGMEARQSVTLSKIIDRARALLVEGAPPAPEPREPPRFERGFYRLARYLRLGSGATTQGRIIVHGPVGDDGDLWVSVAYSDDAGQVSAAALAAAGAGAERVEEEER